MLDVEWMNSTPKGNAGVFIWADRCRRAGNRRASVEVQVLDSRDTLYLNFVRLRDFSDSWREDDTESSTPLLSGGYWSLPTHKPSSQGGQWNDIGFTDYGGSPQA